jgi:hypothetical protein
MLPVLRGFSRNVKQDSEANAVSGGMAGNTTPASVKFAAIPLFAEKF